MIDNNKLKWEQRPEVVAALKEIAESGKGFLVLAGKNGTGKTYASRCVYNFAIQPLKHPAYDHEKAFFTNQTELALTLERKRREFGEVLSFLEYIRDTKYFILDDIGAVRDPSPSVLDFIYAVVDYRKESRLATIITTNKTINDLRITFSDAFVSRVASEKTFRFEGEDRRMQGF